VKPRNPPPAAGHMPPAELAGILERFAVMSAEEIEHNAKTWCVLNRYQSYRSSPVMRAIVDRVAQAPRHDTLLICAEIIAQKETARRTFDAIEDLAAALSGDRNRYRVRASDLLDLYAHGVLSCDLTPEEQNTLADAPRSALATISATIYDNTDDKEARDWLHWLAACIDSAYPTT
jgi:hypothetical protein